MFKRRWEEPEPVKRPRRHKLLVVTKDDFQIVTFKRDKGVRLIHKDSGARAESREQRTQKQNREAAFSCLVLTDIFQTWLRVETAKVLQDEHKLRRRANKDVERVMVPRNLRVEVRRDGRWTKADAPKE